jgi:hypothetical protein
MSISYSEIFDACRPYLERVGMHNTNQRRRFITAYQLWFWMEQNGDPFCQVLREVYGDAIGKEGGDYKGPVQRIAIALGNNSEVETHYIDTRDIQIHDIVPSNPDDCGLFRLKDKGL